jgi:hypothetical protein
VPAEDGQYSDEELEDILLRAKQAVPPDCELVYIEHDEELSDARIAQVLEGKFMELENDLWESTDENRWCGLQDVLKNVLSDPDERAALEADTERFEDLRAYIEEHDTSDPFSEMLHHTRAKLFCFELGYELSEVPEDEVGVRREARAIARVAGLSWATNGEALRELVREADRECSLSVIWFTKPTPVVEQVLAEQVGDAAGWVEVAFRDPHLLLFNSGIGSGHDVPVKGTITRRFLQKDVRLDAASEHRYSWEACAGLNPSAYQTKVDFRPVRQLEELGRELG